MKYLYLIFLIFLTACSAPLFDENKWSAETLKLKIEKLYLPHKKDDTFFNPWRPRKKSFASLLKWKLSKSDRQYSELEQTYLPRVIPAAVKRIKETKEDFIMWVGHDTFLIKLNGIIVITDPILTKRALLPARKTPPAFKLEDLSKISKDYKVIISHSHYDHFDVDTLQEIPGGTMITPLGFKKYQEKFPNLTINEMDWWTKVQIAKDVWITALPTQHWSRRIDQSYNESLWSSYLIETPNKKIYFAGDSGYFHGYKEFGKKFPDIDYALMPITAYQPRWFMHYAHMNVPEAINAFFDLKAKFFIPTQWGTFHLGDNPSGIPAIDLRREIKKKSYDPKKFLIMNIGEIHKLKGDK